MLKKIMIALVAVAALTASFGSGAQAGDTEEGHASAYAHPQGR
jgi:hypothetical protein